MGHETPHVDLVVLMRCAEPLHPEVERGIRIQDGVHLVVHRVVGKGRSDDRCRWDAIVRARNDGKLRGNAPWLMFLDDDVLLGPRCVATLVEGLSRRPMYGALAADYLGQHRVSQVAVHVAMGATLFRRQVLDQVCFAWHDRRCECQCCCDDLRRLHWAIDYYPIAVATHLPKSETNNNAPVVVAPSAIPENADSNEHGLSASTQDPSVCLVVCYFGAPPGWIKQYLKSCEYNSSIDFLILTDQDDFPTVPPNVRVKRLTKASFNSLASKKIGIQVRLSHPRKLCDFKPTYGHLFEELLEGWDYWGYTDLDVIYGDLRQFLSSAKLQDFDVFTARKEFLVGHFSLFRNNHNMRTLYQHSSDFRTTLQFPHVLSFDECGRQWGHRLQGTLSREGAACDSMTHIVLRMATSNRLSASFSPSVIEWPELTASPWRLRWQEGRLWVLNQRREAMYYHFHAFKQQPGYREPRCPESAQVFEMSAHGIERASSSISWVNSGHTVNNGAPPATRAKNELNANALTTVADSCTRAEASSPRVLAAFDRRHLTQFYSRFLNTLRANGNHEVVIPVAIGLYTDERSRLARAANVRPVFRSERGDYVARRRLRVFAELTRVLPPSTPVAYWDAGDVIFQSQLKPLWELVRANPHQLLAAREPSGYPENPVVVLWTESIIDPESRRYAHQTIFQRPFLNSGFVAGTASALTTYFEMAARWYDTAKLSGTTDPGDQLALNLYCHSHSDAWHEIPESWNYCLWGRKTCYRRDDGRYIDSRGVPIHVVHGNAHSLDAVPVRRPYAEVNL